MHEPATTREVDIVALARSRARLDARAAAGEAPWLHAEVARRMAERLALVKLQPEQVLDWSGAAGGSREPLRQAYPRARIVERGGGGEGGASASRWWPFGRARVHTVAAAAVPDAQAQLLWANMTLHAEADPPAAMAQWLRALQVGGFLMFSTLGPGTLAELRALYRDQGWGEAMAPLVDMHDLGDQLVAAGFADPVMDQETVRLTWPDAAAALAELRTLGANVSPHRHAGLRTPRWRERLLAALARAGEKPAMSFEIVYGHAFKAAPRARVQAQTEVSLDDMRRMVRQPRS